MKPSIFLWLGRGILNYYYYYLLVECSSALYVYVFTLFVRILESLVPFIPTNTLCNRILDFMFRLFKILILLLFELASFSDLYNLDLVFFYFFFHTALLFQLFYFTPALDCAIIILYNVLYFHFHFLIF